MAYVTGGSSGIGLAVAKKLVQSGTHVVLLARRKEKLESAGEILRAEGGGGKVYPVSLDVRDREDVERVLGETFDLYGAPDLLINSAGIAYPGYFEEIPYEKFRDIMDINVGGMWNVTRASVPFMKPGSWIVNVSSIAGFLGLFGYTAYSASKFAVVGFSESLRNELSGRGIGVSVLFPPDTKTPQLEEEEKTKPPETRAISGNAKALEPEYVAVALMRGIRRRRFFILPGFQGKLIYCAHRLWPGLIHKIIDGEVRKIEKRKSG